MKIFYNTLLILTLVIAVTNLISPNNELTQKMLRPVSGIMLLSIILSPFLPILNGELESVTDTLPPLNDILFPENDSSDSYELLANMIFSYLGQTYGDELNSNAELVLTVNENEITKISMKISNCPYAIREEIKKALSEEFSTTEIILNGY